MCGGHFGYLGVQIFLGLGSCHVFLFLFLIHISFVRNLLPANNDFVKRAFALLSWEIFLIDFILRRTWILLLLLILYCVKLNRRPCLRDSIFCSSAVNFRRLLSRYLIKLTWLLKWFFLLFFRKGSDYLRIFIYFFNVRSLHRLLFLPFNIHIDLHEIFGLVTFLNFNSLINSLWELFWQTKSHLIKIFLFIMLLIPIYLAQMRQNPLPIIYCQFVQF